jgi:hypothetical protein
MEVIRSYETPVQKPTTRRYIPKDGKIHNYRCENLKSYILCEMFTEDFDVI